MKYFDKNLVFSVKIRLVYLGVVLLLVLVLVVVTGVKQSQLLVPRLKSGLWTGV